MRAGGVTVAESTDDSVTSHGTTALGRVSDRTLGCCLGGDRPGLPVRLAAHRSGDANEVRAVKRGRDFPLRTDPNGGHGDTHGECRNRGSAKLLWVRRPGAGGESPGLA
jgi:hypothetical protein